ncbi:putative MFS-type transporter YfkL [Clostridium zeae]|uniref:MFS-type transporter YfkL n=1 Tax=Clostridium zeae TaxID=2759022 RepID=A0ABQ1EB73_9CLOT|nr:MFS transporter [Clostridium zeae]GFZ31963.1 putative MFS-type transporter YfkL [Clostridium zeae]
MFKSKYFKTALGIYISYCMLGMILILLSSNMAFLTKQFNTDAAGISFLISAEGIVRSATLYAAGRLSDKFGRKRFLCLAPLTMVVFLIGIPLSPSYGLAIVFSAFAGISHAFMDAASYPTLMECFPKTPGTANVLIKAFVATGGALLPFIIAFFVERNMFYGNTFFLIALIVFINGLFIMGRKFPQQNEIASANDEAASNVKFSSEPVFRKEGIALIIIGFTSNSIYTAFQMWMPTFGQKILGLNQLTSLKFITYYSIGAIVSVFILAKLLQKTIKPILVTAVYPIIGIIFLIIVLIFKTTTVATISFALAGFSSAGVLQMAQTTMGELFWRNKGATIALVSTASGIAAAVIPASTGLILRHFGIVPVFYFMLGIYVIAIVASTIARLRYDKVFGKNK